MKTIRVGFIGAGGIANTHARRLCQIEGVKISSCADVEVARGRRFAEEFRCKFYERAEDMERSEELDAIYVCTPPYSRGVEEIFIERCIPTFFEKPVALDMRKSKHLNSLIRRTGVVHSVGYMWRYLDTTDFLKEKISDFGPIGLMIGQYLDPFWFQPGHWWLYKNKGGGQVLEQATHVFDLMRYLVGEVLRVYAEIDNLIVRSYMTDMTSEDSSVVVMRFSSGPIGVVFSTCASRRTHTGTSIKIITRDAVFEHGGHSGYAKVYSDDSVEEVINKLDPYMEEDLVFIEAVRRRSMDKIRSTFEDAIKTLNLTLAANEASNLKRVIEVANGDWT
ncbi:MAG: Gfo/Idh/MocA family oxidoreductase [Candidatus Bathyarchaeia archaeon]